MPTLSPSLWGYPSPSLRAGGAACSRYTVVDCFLEIWILSSFTWDSVPLSLERVSGEKSPGPNERLAIGGGMGWDGEKDPSR